MNDTRTMQQAMTHLLMSLSSKREAFEKSDYHTSMAALDDLLATMMSIRVLANSLGNIAVSNAMTEEILSMTRTEPTDEETAVFASVAGR